MEIGVFFLEFPEDVHGIFRDFQRNLERNFENLMAIFSDFSECFVEISEKHPLNMFGTDLKITQRWWFQRFFNTFYPWHLQGGPTACCTKAAQMLPLGSPWVHQLTEKPSASTVPTRDFLTGCEFVRTQSVISLFLLRIGRVVLFQFRR